MLLGQQLQHCALGSSRSPGCRPEQGTVVTPGQTPGGPKQQAATHAWCHGAQYARRGFLTCFRCRPSQSLPCACVHLPLQGTLAKPFLSERLVALRVHNTDFVKRWFMSHRAIRVPKKPTWHLQVGPKGPLPGDLCSSGACHMHAVLGLWGHWQVDVSSAFLGSQPSGTGTTDPCEMLQTIVSCTVYEAEPRQQAMID